MSRTIIRHCRNPKCREPLRLFSNATFCPSCRYLARWAFALGALLAGVLTQLLEVVL